ncbi:MAG: DNA mismatch repair endonuclease MutL [Spirochaetaceae bacterium]|nr:MAG: DNA mismatch repair endonuclease MutL [Spirochaetaceae bacterium]
MTHTHDTPTGKVQVLPGSISGKIAAGEVIERPASVLRELLDNSIDAGAREITVELEDGGLQRIRVSDNGCGMSSDDVALCVKTHATSKIRTLEDLNHIETLGFRGEALSSIAHVARLEIGSRQASGDGGRIVIANGTVRDSGPALGSTGTVVDVQQLFHNLPGRKRFLKRSSTERSLCKAVFIEKALAHTGISFRLFADTHDPLVVSGSEYAERICEAYPDFPRFLFTTFTYTGDAAGFDIVLADPSIHRRDRKMIQTFVNGRRVWEYGFAQAVEYGTSDLYHGGIWPVCFIFMNVDPYTVDFNIHPAKREARFLHRDRIHHDIVTALKRPGAPHPSGSPPVQDGNTRNSPPVDSPSLFQGSRSDNRPFMHRGAEIREPFPSVLEPARQIASPRPENSRHPNDIRYVGRVFEVFIAVEREKTLYLIDQHAAHERLLYDRLRADTRSQELLIPIEFTVESDEVALLIDRMDAARSIGIVLEHKTDNVFRITAIPKAYFGKENDLTESLRGLELVSGEFERNLYSSIACKAAIRYGDTIDPSTACELARSVFNLDEPRCPHGRPLYVAVTETELRSAVGREELRSRATGQA